MALLARAGGIYGLSEERGGTRGSEDGEDVGPDTKQLLEDLDVIDQLNELAGTSLLRCADALKRTTTDLTVTRGEAQYLEIQGLVTSCVLD